MFENETVRTIRLYGEVGRLFGRTHRFVAASMRDVMRALGAQIPGFEAYMAEAAASRQGFACLVGKRSLTEDELKGDFPAEGDIRIAPVIQAISVADCSTLCWAPRSLRWRLLRCLLVDWERHSRPAAGLVLLHGWALPWSLVASCRQFHRLQRASRRATAPTTEPHTTLTGRPTQRRRAILCRSFTATPTAMPGAAAAVVSQGIYSEDKV